jgi:hypothetical protein
MIERIATVCNTRLIMLAMLAFGRARLGLTQKGGWLHWEPCSQKLGVRFNRRRLIPADPRKPKGAQARRVQKHGARRVLGLPAFGGQRE